MVDYLGLFRELLLVTYFFKVTKRVKVVFSQFEYHEEVWCDILPLTFGHVCLGADWFAQHRVPNVQNWPNVVRDRWGNHLETYMLPEPQREDICVGTNMASEGEQYRSEVSSQACGGPLQHGKGELTQELQGALWS
ncbi:uncharacterized protein LOC124889247 [Capsicum annuum]|uniref:uncharacterized protein LOC124889247 n=1 Tax=Capsicum annuum TaxID=4072 RepID=UPI001FB0E262|nr:uncharacterized protein LOC124889247 [Capsicum annuum]